MGGVVASVGAMGLCCSSVDGIVVTCFFVQIIPSNSNVVVGGGGLCLVSEIFVGRLPRSIEVERFGRVIGGGSLGAVAIWRSYSPRISFVCCSPFNIFFLGWAVACCGQVSVSSGGIQ